MAKLMEVCLSVIPGNQRWLTFRSFHKVRVVRRQNVFVTIKGSVSAIGSCPGAGAFTLTSERIQIPQTNQFTGILIGHFPYFHIRMEYRYRARRNRFKVKVEQASGDIKHGFAQFIQLQVLFHLIGIEVVFRETNFFGVKTIIPGFNFDVRTFGIGNGLHVGYFFLNPGECRWPHFHHQCHGIFRVLRHAVFETPLSVVIVTEQLNAFMAQGKNLFDDVVVIKLVAVITAVVIGAPYFFA